MDKMKMHSPNLAEENIAKIGELFPNCVVEKQVEIDDIPQVIKSGPDKGLPLVERAIDFDLLRQEISTNIVEGPQERYTLNWPGKREALLTANAPIAKTLRPCREESVNFDITENLFIEGDNLDALKLLQEIYLGKVKMIYIDPPYNTGKDFIYADDFAESTEEFLLDSGQRDEEGNRLVANTESNGRFHSDWLSMMYSRLKLARNLLKDDGVIFISLDDCEIHNLRRICDEVFGENNFISNIIWEKKFSPQNDEKYISASHDHILLYTKEKSRWSPNLLPRSAESLKKFKNLDNDHRGVWTSGDLTSKTKAAKHSYPITSPSGKVHYPPKGRQWAPSLETFKSWDEDNRIWYGKNGDNVPRIKQFLSEVQDGVVPMSIWRYEDVGHNQSATQELKRLFDGASYFDSPKPMTLINKVLQISTSPDDIILDFFAGSATTAHSVMQLNAEDGGNRKFIMVQLPEACDEKSEAFKAGYENIAEISKERIRRAGKKIKDKLTEKKNKEQPTLFDDPNSPSTTNPSSLDTGFRVLKVSDSNMKEGYYAPDQMVQTKLFEMTDNIKEDRTSEDLLFQVLLDWGVDLTLPIFKENISGQEVLFVDDNALASCFVKDGSLNEEFCKELAKKQPLRVVFRDSGFKDDSVKINVEQIFKQMSPHTEVRTI